ncbi:malonate decarboxylase subunit epsilon [Undibacterium terreum]|uniref:Malonate decarboxylase subunit epsilon n=2 Tax=Undibacterium terreum TaxID=1224302 RepID=A0A916XBH2_9BURK|nr:malonate decarboxylase subunit epsilon [Undibacterium terreum]
MSRLAILCPGQGAQYPLMFELARQDEQARSLLQEWDLQQYLDLPLQEILADDKLIFQNTYAQPLIVAASLAAWSALKNKLPAPRLVMGYSVGELSAYAVAGSLSVNDALALATVRAKLMDNARAQTGAQHMLSVGGLAFGSLAETLQRHGLYVAIIVGDASFIIGGLTASIMQAIPDFHELGAETSLIPVEIASHTPLMQAAVPGFQKELEARVFGDPGIPVMSGIGAELTFRQDAAKTQLLRQLTETIRWADCMDSCAEQGITVALELGPGAALSSMLQKRHPGIACRSVRDFRSLAGLLAWVDRFYP